MSSIYSQFKTNSDKENQGTSIHFGKNDDGSDIVFILARMGKSNKAYAKELDRQISPIRRQIQLNAVSESQSDAIMLDVFVKTVLLNWENVQDENNTNIIFSIENAKKLLTDLPDLYEELQSQAQNISLFKAEESEEMAKN